ncbi:response regulator transcription factor [Pontiellaceae bacterium B12227]|nr:response regulator transcription factor [Pontiellaceae bacterium B12227]
MQNKITIMLVEDNEAYRNVIKRSFSRDANMELVSQFSTAEIALRSLQELSTRTVPDIILLDLNLPGMSGLEALPYFRQALPDTRIIILTQSDKESDILEAISKGTSGYLLKSATNRQLKDGIRTVMDGGASLDPDVARLILEGMEQTPKQKKPEISLTEKEHSILVLIGQGLEQKDIAKTLCITRNTVAYHIKHIYEKLEVQNAPAAISKAYQTGLFSPGKM